MDTRKPLVDLGVETGLIRVALHLRLLFSGNLVQSLALLPRTFDLNLYPYAIIPMDRPPWF